MEESKVQVIPCEVYHSSVTKLKLIVYIYRLSVHKALQASIKIGETGIQYNNNVRGNVCFAERDKIQYEDKT